MDAIDATDAINATDAMDAINASDAIDAMDATTLHAIDAMDSIDAIWHEKTPDPFSVTSIPLFSTHTSSRAADKLDFLIVDTS